MRVSRKQFMVAAMALTSGLSGCVIPTSEHPSLWTTLGVPQVWNAAGGHMINRRGGRPERELKPPVKRIADPANLESEVPAIKKAAEIKKAEDAKAQKIKAVRYLAESAGCGCYDEEGEVTEALVAALEDCTEEVRFATVKALLARAESQKKNGPCSRCSGGCCNQKLIDKLSSLVYDLDDKGCRVEPSERVRTTAKAVLQICCPAQCQNYYPQQAQPTPEPVAPPEPQNKKNLEGPDEPMETEPEAVPNPQTSGPALNEDREEAAQNDLEIPTFSMAEDNGLSPVGYAVPSSDEGVSVAAAAQTVVMRSENSQREVVTGGSVAEVSADENRVLVEFNQAVTVPVGTRLQLKRRQQLGRIEYLGEVEVVESEEGCAIVCPIAPLSIKRIGVKDAVMLTR